MLYFVCLLAIVGSAGSMQTSDDDRMQSQVNNFRMYRGFAATFEASMAGDFIEIVDEQRNELQEIQDRFRAKASSIIGKSDQSWADKYDQLVKLREKQDGELKNVLLPEQLSRLEFLKQYTKIQSQGFADSLCTGSLAKHLALSDAERKEVNWVAVETSEAFRKEAIKAQQHAIARIRKSLPDEKRKELDKLLKPLLAGDGTFWDVDLRMLETSSMQGNGR